MDEMNIDDVLARACKGTPLPEYDPDDQYSEPFACESSYHGNYFKNAGITDICRSAAMENHLPETLVDIAMDMIEGTDDVKWAKSEYNQNRQIIGTMRMMLRRWAKGGYGEALAMVEYGYVSESEALMTVFEKTGERYNGRQDMDENAGIDFVTPAGDMVQVKTTVNRPNWKENKTYDKLVWVKPETYELEEIEP